MRFIRLQRSVENKFTSLLGDSLTALSVVWQTWKRQRRVRLSDVELPNISGISGESQTMTNRKEVLFGQGIFNCFVEDGEVRVQMTIVPPSPFAGQFWYFRFPPDDARHVVDRIQSCLYEIVAQTEDQKSE